MIEFIKEFYEFLKVRKKYLLNMRFNDSKTYWTNKVKKIDSMDKQF